MITILPGDERGHTRNDWLQSWHGFSFGEYFDPERMGFRTLRVLNDDRVAPGKGFPMHGHRDMEIVSYVVKGQMEHKDNLGNGSVVHHGEVLAMSAGAGIQHGERNPSATEPLHLVQIWIVPRDRGGEPTYSQAAFDMDEARRNWVVLAAPEGGAVTINQDAVVAATIAPTGERRSLEFSPGRYGYLFVARGVVRFHGNELRAGDAAMIEDESHLEFESISEAEVLAFDLG